MLDHHGFCELEIVDLTFGFITMLDQLKGVMRKLRRIQDALTTGFREGRGGVLPLGFGLWDMGLFAI